LVDTKIIAFFVDIYSFLLYINQYKALWPVRTLESRESAHHTRGEPEHPGVLFKGGVLRHFPVVLTDAQEDVYRVVAKDMHWHSPVGVGLVLGIPDKRQAHIFADAILRDLVEIGMVERNSRGYYRKVLQ